VALVNHHLVGVAGQAGSGQGAGPYLDVPLGYLGVSGYGGGGQDSVRPVFQAVAGLANAYTQEVLRQIQSASAVSVPLVLERANDRTQDNDIFTATSSNWYTIQGQLAGWSQAEKDQVDPYITDGYTVDLPKYGDLTQTGWTWTGMGSRPLMSPAAIGAALPSVAR
jgi:hypothetical protein